MNMHTVTIRLDEQAWSKLRHEARRTGLLAGPLARSYILAALESVELPPQDPLPTPASGRSENARKRKKR